MQAYRWHEYCFQLYASQRAADDIEARLWFKMNASTRVFIRYIS
jgi:hypothetical protein